LVDPVVQSVQETPPLPHAFPAVPATHTPPWQQPLGQVAALHETHCWFTHFLPVAVQSSHETPLPQAVSDAPPWHTPSLQHPDAQVVALHAVHAWP
jgi:hypothetical protein